MRQVGPKDDHRADPIDVAKIVYKAVTDGERIRHYPVVSKKFIDQ